MLFPLIPALPRPAMCSYRRTAQLLSVLLAVLAAPAALAQPDLTVSPAALAVTAPAGETVTAAALAVRNDGSAPLAFSLPQLAAPVPAEASAPDGYGYRWIDSDAPGGPVFDAEDISPQGNGLGTELDLRLGSGEVSVRVALPFAFPFYGERHDSVHVSWGFLAFAESPPPNTYAQSFPNPEPPNAVISALWGTVGFSTVSRIYTATLPDGRFVVQYHRFYQGGDGLPFTAQTILAPSGEIEVQFLSVDPDHYGFGLGIENADGTEGQNVRAWRYARAGLALRFFQRPPFVTSAAPTGGSLAPGEATDVAVTFSADGLTAGTYTNDLIVEDGAGSLTVPLSLTVTGEGQLEVAPTAVAFGPTVTGETERALVTLRNAGANTLQITDVAVSGTGFSADFAAPLTLGPGEATAGTVTFAPAATGAASGTLTVTSNDPDAPTRTVPLSGEGILAPALAWSPSALAATTTAGGTATAALTLQNTGAGPLEFAFPGFEEQRLGGPDGFGYWWSDSNDPTGPAFDWIDISATGTRVTLDSQTDHAFVDLPFAFPFYGEAKTELGINGNGFLSFGEEPTSGPAAVFNDPIPTIYPPNDLIAVLWTWLGSGNGVYYQDMADGRFVVAWDDLPHALDGSVRNTFQAVLHEDGTILFQYLEAPPSDRAGPSIGIENATGTVGLAVDNGDDYAEDGLAVRISTGLPLISAVTPASGTIPPGGSAPVTVTFDADSLNGGLYEGVLKLRTNDPAQRHASIPAALTVEGEAGITVEPEALAFGAIVTGQTATATVTVGNVGTEVLRVSGATAPDPFAVSPAGPFALAPDSSRTLTVTFAPGATGTFSEVLTIASDDPMMPTRTVALSGEGIEAPAVVVSPDSIVAAAAVGAAVTATLTVENTGAGPLFWRLPQFADSTAAARGGPRSAGGPDAFGYRWADSDEPGGPAFEWVDISQAGTRLDVYAHAHNGPRWEVVSLPFTFFLYGQPYDEVKVSYEGALAFEPFTPSWPFGSRPIPSTFEPNGLAAVYWGDMDEGGEVRYATLDDGRFVVQWTAIPSWIEEEDLYTFQAILDRAHGLTLQYLDMDTPHTYGTVVGIENTDGTDGLVVAQSTFSNNYDPSALPTSGTAVQITAPTAFLASAVPAAGTVAPGETAEVTLTLSAEDFVDGTYTGDLVVTSNDPARPRVDVPATFTVSGAAAITASPASLDFGSVFVGNETELEVVVTNPGTETLVVSEVSVTGDGFSVAPAEGFSLAPLFSDTLTVTFAPAEVGAAAGSLALSSDAPGTPVLEVPLAGEGAPPPVAEVSEDFLGLAVPQGNTETRTFTLTNTGGSPLAYTLRVSPGGNPIPPLRPGSAAPPTASRDAGVGGSAGVHPDPETGTHSERRGDAGQEAARGGDVELIPLARAAPGDVVYLAPFTPDGSSAGLGDLTAAPDGSVYAASGRYGWTVRYAPNLAEMETFRHPVASDYTYTNGVAYNEDTETLWYLNAGEDFNTFGDTDPQLIETGLDGVPTGRTVALPELQPLVVWRGLAYNERTGHFFTLETYTDDIYAFTMDGAVVPGYPVPQTSGDEGDVPLYGHGLDAWGDHLDVPFGRNGIAHVAVTDLAGEDTGVETPIAGTEVDFAGNHVVRSRTQPNALMYTPGYGTVYAIAPAVRDDLKPFLRVTSDSTGTLAPGASVDVGLLFDSLDLPLDFFAKRVRIETDSPVTPLLVVTGRMNVTPPGATPTEPGPLPVAFALDRNYPNPFEATTRIGYALPEAEHVTLRVYDGLGRLVATLMDGPRPAGFHEAAWEAGGVASGMYVYRLVAGDFEASRRMMILR